MFEEDVEQYMGVEVFETGIIVPQSFRLINTDTHPVGLEKHVGGLFWYLWGIERARTLRKG
jgi:hypothetical protein